MPIWFFSTMLVLSCSPQPSEKGPPPHQSATSPTPTQTPVIAATAKVKTTTKLLHSLETTNTIFLWRKGSLQQYKIGDKNAVPIVEGKRDSYTFDARRNLIWLYHTIESESNSTIQIEFVDYLQNQLQIFAQGISSKYTEIMISEVGTLYGGNMLSEGLCYVENLAPSPCGLALGWSEPKRLNISVQNGHWQSTSGMVTIPKWLSQRKPATVRKTKKDRKKIPLPSGEARECECWGEQQDCGTGIPLSNNQLSLVLTGVSCGDLYHASCSLYDERTKQYIALSKQQGSKQIKVQKANNQALDSSGVSCALIESAKGDWFATADGIFCTVSPQAQLTCHQLDGHVAGWTSDIQLVKVAE